MADLGVSKHITSVHEQERTRAEEQAHVHSASTAAPTFAGTRPWMERTRWEITYQGVRWDILRSLTEMPWGSPSVEYILGTGSSSVYPELVSLRTDKAKIILLTVAVDRMLDRCE